MFARQIGWLKKRFSLVSMEEAQLRIARGRNREPCVSITFDDGYADNCQAAIPLLTATANVSTGQLTTIVITSPGSGYTVATVHIVGDGVGATATATISSGNIVAIMITSPGTGYTVPPAVTIIGDGAGATLLATVSYQQVESIILTNAGTGYTYGPFVLITGNGTGAAALATLNQTSARVDLSVSYDGGQIFGNDYPYVLNPNGVRQNMLNWWNLGITNDIICRFRFYALGRFVAYNGELNIR